MMKRLSLFVLLCLATLFVASASAKIVYESSYATVPVHQGLPMPDGGYVNGALNGGTQGWRWFGTPGPNYNVETVLNGGSGYVEQNTGVMWTAAGMAQHSAFGPWGNSGVGTPGTYNPGDKMAITYDYQFTANADTQEEVLRIGIDDDQSDWVANPAHGVIAVYIDSVQSGNPYGQLNLCSFQWDGALMLAGEDIGLDASTSDFTSDNLSIDWEIETSDGTNWDRTDLTVTNLDTLGSWTYSGAAPSSFAWTFDSFFGMGMSTQAGAGSSSINEYVKFEYVPEPMTLALLGMGALSILRRRRA